VRWDPSSHEVRKALEEIRAVRARERSA